MPGSATPPGPSPTPPVPVRVLELPAMDEDSLVRVTRILSAQGARLVLFTAPVETGASPQSLAAKLPPGSDGRPRRPGPVAGTGARSGRRNPDGEGRRARAAGGARPRTAHQGALRLSRHRRSLRPGAALRRRRRGQPAAAGKQCGRIGGGQSHPRRRWRGTAHGDRLPPGSGAGAGHGGGSAAADRRPIFPSTRPTSPWSATSAIP